MFAAVFVVSWRLLRDAHVQVAALPSESRSRRDRKREREFSILLCRSSFHVALLCAWQIGTTELRARLRQLKGMRKEMHEELHSLRVKPLSIPAPAAPPAKEPAPAPAASSNAAANAHKANRSSLSSMRNKVAPQPQPQSQSQSVSDHATAATGTGTAADFRSEQQQQQALEEKLESHLSAIHSIGRNGLAAAIAGRASWQQEQRRGSRGNAALAGATGGGSGNGSGNNSGTNSLRRSRRGSQAAALTAALANGTGSADSASVGTAPADGTRSQRGSCSRRSSNAQPGVAAAVV